MWIGCAFLQVRAQAGEAAAAADQNQRCSGVRALEARVAADTQVDLAANVGMLAQPAGAQSGAAVSLVLQAYQQVEVAAAAARGNRVFAVWQGRQFGKPLRDIALIRPACRQMALAQGIAQQLAIR